MGQVRLAIAARLGRLITTYPKADMTTTEPVWKTVPDLSFIQGTASSISVADCIDGDVTLELVGTPPDGITFDAAAKRFDYDGIGNPAEGSNFKLVATSVDAPAPTPEPAPAPVPVPEPIPAPVPTPTPPADADWKYIVREGQVATVPDNSTVRYGANGSYVTKTVSGNFIAMNSYFGSDPAPGVIKHADLLIATDTPAPAPDPVPAPVPEPVPLPAPEPQPTPKPTPAPIPPLVEKIITIGTGGEARALLDNLANVRWRSFDHDTEMTSCGKGVELAPDGDIQITIKTRLATGREVTLSVDNYTGANRASYYGDTMFRVVP